MNYKEGDRVIFIRDFTKTLTKGTIRTIVRYKKQSSTDYGRLIVPIYDDINDGYLCDENSLIKAYIKLYRNKLPSYF